MYFQLIFLARHEVSKQPLAISINITIHGTNQNSFAGLKSILEQAIADAINVPVSSVSSLFVETAPTTSFSDDMAVINWKIQPIDTNQETDVLEKINRNRESLVLDINAKLHKNNAKVLTIDEVKRVPGKLVHCIL